PSKPSYDGACKKSVFINAPSKRCQANIDCKIHVRTEDAKNPTISSRPAGNVVHAGRTFGRVGPDVAQSHASSVGAGCVRARTSPGLWGSLSPVSSVLASAGSVMTATTLRRPPQGHCSTSSNAEDGWTIS